MAIIVENGMKKLAKDIRCVQFAKSIWRINRIMQLVLRMKSLRKLWKNY